MGDKRKLVRALALVVLTLLLLGTASLSYLANPGKASTNLVPFAQATSPTTSQFGMVELGYDPLTLTPINVSLPTYTLGDQMWMQSSFNSSVQATLVTPLGTVVANKTVEPSSATLIFTFQAGFAYDGNWTLDVSNPILQNFSVPITFVDPSAHGMSASRTTYGFRGGQLAVGFQLSLAAGSYGVQGCLLPVVGRSAIVLNVPSLAGSTVSVQNEGNGSVLISAGGLGAPSSSSLAFEFWIELYYQYSYETAGPFSSFFSTYQEAALTNPVLISPLSQTAHPALDSLVGMRSGTYELRAFFESGGNLSVEQTTVLIQGASLPWLAMSGCVMSPLIGPLFVASSTLSNSSDEWPTDLFMSYYVNGIGFYLLEPLDVQISGFTLLVRALQQVPANIGVEVNVSSGEFEVVGESVFIATLSPTFQVNYSLTYGGKIFETSAPTTYTNYSTFQKVGVDLGKMSVIVTHDGRGYPNATVTLKNNALNASVTFVSGTQGNATFFGPPGSYTLSATSNGSTITKIVSIQGGESSTQEVSLDPTPGGEVLSAGELNVVIVASVVAGLGIVANLWVWAFKGRKRFRRI